MALDPTPSENIRLIAFDLDGTLVDETIFIWQTLHEHFATDNAKRQQARSDYRDGRIDYSAWFQTDLELLSARGARRESIQACFSGLTPAPGAQTTLHRLKNRGYKLGLISGSLDILLDHFFPSHPFDHVLINRIQFGPDGRISGGQHTPYDMAGKADGLAELARREKLTLEQCAFVGDNVNDLQVMEAAGLAIGIQVKHDDVKVVCDRLLPGDGLPTLLEWFPGPPS